ncbi:MAG: MSCRAMM family protein [Clostridium sp.]
MKKKYIISVLAGVIVVAVLVVGGVVVYNLRNSSLGIDNKVSALESKNQKNGIPLYLSKQGKEGNEKVGENKYKTITVGESDNSTIAIFPTAGTKIENVDSNFEKAVSGKSYNIGPGFIAKYDSKDGWMVTYKGEENPYSKHVTSDLVPKWIKSTDKTGYLYVPASSGKNQGFLMGYNLDNSSPFDWEVHINGTSTTIPRLNAFNLNGLMLNTDYGFYANKAGILYIFNDTNTMVLQNKEYPNMKFIFNNGAKNNIEPIENMGYYNDSSSKEKNINNNIPVIYPISSTEGYIYQKPTENAQGWIWFFNTNWNNGKPLNANGVMIPKGNYEKPVYNNVGNTVTVNSYNGIKGAVAVANSDFNGLYTNPTSSSAGAKALEISVKNSNGGSVQGQGFNVENSNGNLVAKNVVTNSDGQIILYGLPEGTYTVSSVNGNFTIGETVINNTDVPVANLVYDNNQYTAPANLNSTTGTITVTSTDGSGGVNLYQDGQLVQSSDLDSNNQAIFTDITNGIYTVATTDGNGDVTSSQYQVGINSTDENGAMTFHTVDNLTTGNIFAEVKDSSGNVVSNEAIELLQNGSVVDTQSTGVSGTVNFENEPFGSYTLKEVSNGQTQDVSIDDTNYTAWGYFTN